MSALGQKPTSAPQKDMSALPLKVDMDWRPPLCQISKIVARVICITVWLPDMGHLAFQSSRAVIPSPSLDTRRSRLKGSP
jgi:hypothetical protein